MPLPEAAPEPPSDLGRAVAEAGRHYLEHRPRGFRDDCSGYVCAVFTRAGVPLQGNSASLWEDAKRAGTTHRRKRPDVGDLAFFDNTYDRNRNGRRDDPLTHVAVVLEVRDDGTIVLGHGGTSRGRALLHMNLRHASEHRAPSGAVLNDYLRARSSRDSEGARVLSGELWRGFAAAPTASGTVRSGS